MNFNMSNQKGFANIVLIVLVVVLAGGAIYFALRKSTPEPTAPSATEQPAPTTSLIGKWRIVSVEENSVLIVSDGNGATIEFSENGTYQALGGCNQMMTQSYKMYSDSKLSISVGGTKKLCAKNIVEFWDLGGVYSYELNNDNLLLHYKGEVDTGTFKLKKVSTN